MDKNNSQLVPLDSKDQDEIEKLKLKIVATTSNNNSGEIVSCSTSRKKPRQILEEEEYTSQIATIIERDFFPDVTKFRYELEYQDAVDKHDFAKIEYLRNQNVETKSSVPDTPASFETPLLSKDETFPEKRRKGDVNETTPSDAKKIGLNSFLNKYTSEDNDAFEQLQEESYRKYLEKIEYSNTGVESHNQQIAAALEVPSCEKQAFIKAGLEINNGERLITWKYSTKNSVMFDPEGVSFTKEEENNRKGGQVILHENTRFQANPFDVVRNASSSNKTIKPLKNGKIGIDGKEVDLNATPNVNGFKFVPSTPTFAPETLPGSPLMTWGEIDATPTNIRGDSTPLARSGLTPNSSHFKMPDVPQREKVGQVLANQILAKKKQARMANKSAGFGKKDSYISSLERLNSMSPAAQFLATKKLGVNSSIDRSLQASYSPMSPLMSSNRTPTPRQFNIIKTNSPRTKSTPTGPKKLTHKTASSISSNQNEIKRARAEEFF